MAAPKPIQLKLASAKLANATPPTTGTNAATTAGLGVAPKNKYENKTLKNGSIALIVCVKLTATLPNEMFVNKFPTV